MRFIEYTLSENEISKLIDCILCKKIELDFECIEFSGSGKQVPYRLKSEIHELNEIIKHLDSKL